MDLDKLLKQADSTDPESLDTLSRELERRGYGRSERESASVLERLLNHKKTDIALIDQWLEWFNTEMDPFETLADFKNMPGGGGDYYTQVAFIFLLKKKRYEVYATTDDGDSYEPNELLLHKRDLGGFALYYE